jgi:hypothetical protein
MTLTNLLQHIQNETGGRFIVANFKEADKTKQHWLNNYISYNATPFKLFSNRLFYTTNCWRHLTQLQNLERFFRIDLENTTAHHEYTPTDQEYDMVIEWAKEEGACGVLKTAHGAHVYFLTDTQITHEEFKQHISEPQLENLKIDAKASFCRNNWSKTHNHNLIYASKTIKKLVKNNTTTTPNKDLIYCETFLDNRNVVSSSAGDTSIKNRQSIFLQDLGGSEAVKHIEFSAILSAYVKGADLYNVPMSFHKPEVLLRTFSTDAYAWVENARLNYNASSSFDLLGCFSHTRCIQRNFSFLGHLRHALSDYAKSNYTAEAVLSKFLTSDSFSDLRALGIKKFGNKLGDTVLKEFEAIRERFGSEIGLFEVSPEIFKQVFKFARGKKYINVQKLLQYLSAENRKRNTFHVARGLSRSHCYKALSYMKKSGALGKGYAIISLSRLTLDNTIALAKKPVQPNTYETDKNIKSVEETGNTAENLQPVAKRIFKSSPKLPDFSPSACYNNTSCAWEDWRDVKRHKLLDGFINEGSQDGT